MRMRLNNQVFFSRTRQRNCDAVVGESFVFTNSVKCLWRRWSISADIRLWKRALFPGVLANIVSSMPPPPYNPAPQINRINMMIKKKNIKNIQNVIKSIQQCQDEEGIWQEWWHDAVDWLWIWICVQCNKLSTLRFCTEQSYMRKRGSSHWDALYPFPEANWPEGLSDHGNNWQAICRVICTRSRLLLGLSCQVTLHISHTEN